MSVDQLIADLYGAAPTEEGDLLKTAAALVMDDGSDEGYVEDYTEAELAALAQDPDVLHKTAELVLEQRADDEEFMEKFAGYDWAGRLMAHAFNDEMEKIAAGLEGEEGDEYYDDAEYYEDEEGIEYDDADVEYEEELDKIAAAYDEGVIDDLDVDGLVKEAGARWEATKAYLKRYPGVGRMKAGYVTAKAARATKKAGGEVAKGQRYRDAARVAAGGAARAAVPVGALGAAAYGGSRLKKRSSLNPYGLSTDEAYEVLEDFVDAGGDVDELMKEAGARIEAAKKFGRATWESGKRGASQLSGYGRGKKAYQIMAERRAALKGLPKGSRKGMRETLKGKGLGLRHAAGQAGLAALPAGAVAGAGGAGYALSSRRRRR